MLPERIFDSFAIRDIANEGGENIAALFFGKMAERDLDGKFVSLPMQTHCFRRAPVELFFPVPKKTPHTPAMRLAQTFGLDNGDVVSHQPRRRITEHIQCRWVRVSNRALLVHDHDRIRRSRPEQPIFLIRQMRRGRWERGTCLHLLLTCVRVWSLSLSAWFSSPRSRRRYFFPGHPAAPRRKAGRRRENREDRSSLRSHGESARAAP